MLTPLAILLIASPQIGGGFSLGTGALSDDPILQMTPWAGLQAGEFALALKAPLRFELETGHLRERDFDESEDYARFLTTLRWGEVAHLGTIDVRFGEGTLVDHFSNAVDQDHGRIGSELHLGPDQWGAPLAIDLFASRALGAPVAGGQFSVFTEDFNLKVALASDFHAPKEVQNRADKAGNLAARYEKFYGLGAEISRDFEHVTLYSAANLQGQEDLSAGLHFGLHIEAGEVFEARVEGQILQDRYDPSPFDRGYLFDAWTSRIERPKESATWGGRASVAFHISDKFRLELDYSDADRKESARLEAVLALSLQKFELISLYRARYLERDEIFHPEHALWAASCALQPSPRLKLRATAARSPSVEIRSDESAQYNLIHEGLFSVEFLF